MKYIFLGGQGSGKSTQARLLAEKLNLPCIEMGQILRDKAKESDTESLEIRKSLEQGVLVKDEITVKVLNEELKKPKYANGYVLDGYPRNKHQMEGLTDEIDTVFYVNVSDKEAIRRLSLRKREDDTFELLSRRLAIYHEQTEPLIEIFKNKNILEEVNGEQTIEEIHQAILKITDN